MIDLQIMPNELAIATALSSRPSQYFYALVINNFSHLKLSFQFVRSFINRLFVERPDFEVTLDVGLAILCLYSQYLRASIEEAAQLQLFVFDPLADEFEDLNSLIKERVQISDLLGVYQFRSKAYGLDGGEIWSLELRERRLGALTFHARQRILPDVLWVRKNLVDENSVATGLTN
jgi:hypothetical protein